MTLWDQSFTEEDRCCLQSRMFVSFLNMKIWSSELIYPCPPVLVVWISNANKTAFLTQDQATVCTYQSSTLKCPYFRPGPSFPEVLHTWFETQGGTQFLQCYLARLLWGQVAKAKINSRAHGIKILMFGCLNLKLWNEMHLYSHVLISILCARWRLWAMLR